jgi:hypothetical protein
MLAKVLDLSKCPVHGGLELFAMLSFIETIDLSDTKVISIPSSPHKKDERTPL